MTGTELVPYVKPAERWQQLYGWHYEWWRKLEDKWNPPFEIPNIRFHYDHDDFFNRNLSIRAARDWKNSPFWFYIALLFFASQLAAMGFGVSFRLLKPFIPELDLPGFL